MIGMMVMSSVTLIRPSTSSLSLPAASSPHVHAAPRHSPAKEHVEDLLRCHVGLEPVRRIVVLVESVMMATAASNRLFISIQIILSLLLCI